ncbi:MAG: glycosyltransferase family 2 protein [bacterium]|nr:glycosyltransferase family 2 protein [bacterium]
MNKLPELSVFFPAYNEEDTIESTVLKAVDECQKIADIYEIIIVNDGSRDKTGEIIEILSKNNSYIKIITHSPNRGYGGALKSGMYAAQYKYIAFNDSDGQFDFSQIERFLPYIAEYSLIIGYRTNRIEGIRRLANAKAWSFLINILFGLHVKDVDCAFKLFNQEILQTIQPLQSEGALISTEFLVKAKRAGFKIKEVPVDHLPRKGGTPTGANLKVIIKAFYELLKLWRKIK